MAKRLSTDTARINTQIETSKALIETYTAELEKTPLEDELGHAVIQRDLSAEKITLGRLNRHLDGLETEFDELYESTYDDVRDPFYED